MSKYIEETNILIKKLYSKEEVKKIIYFKNKTNNIFSDEEIYKYIIKYKSDDLVLNELNYLLKLKSKGEEYNWQTADKKGKISKKEKNNYSFYKKRDNNFRELFLKGIKYSANEYDLKKVFSRYGKVVFCKILREKGTNKSRGIGFVKFSSHQSLLNALDDSDNIYCKGRKIEIEIKIDFYKNNKNRKLRFVLFYDINSFCVFESIHNNIIYNENNTNSIKAINFIDNKEIIEIKNAHNNTIDNFFHYQDKINKRNLIFSQSSDNNGTNIKLWDINNWECLYDCNYENWDLINLIVDNNQFYCLLLSDVIDEPYKTYKIYDLQGNLVKTLKDIHIDEQMFFSLSMIDVKFNKNYIVTGHRGYIQSIDFRENKIQGKIS